MIYLKNENIIIPNICGIYSDEYTLVLKNNVTNEEFEFTVKNESENNFYYSFKVDTSNLPDNEYTITLSTVIDEETVSLGIYLAQKGINKAQKTSFNSDTEYIQFN